MKRTIARVATRKSRLAVRQAELAVQWLTARMPGAEFELMPLSTQGDERLQWSLEKEGGKGLFTSELENAVLSGEAEIAVHSAKDLPTAMPDGLSLAGFLPREAPEDVLVMGLSVTIPTVVATGSPRRRAQLQDLFPGAEWPEIRGNVQTRLGRIVDGEVDATLLAAAGLRRLGLIPFPGVRMLPLPVTTCVPAAGQGAIAIQCRTEDLEKWRQRLCRETAVAVEAERRALAAMGGGCHSAAAAHWRNGVLHAFEGSRGYRRWNLPASRAVLPDVVESAIRSWL